MCLSTGNKEKLSSDDSRLTFDDRSESRGLFTVVRADDKKIIKANSGGLVGQGVLIVRVHNVYNVHVTVNVVGYSSLQLTAVPYPIIERSNATLTSLKRIGSHHGNVQLAALKLCLVLTDKSTTDVSTMTSTSFRVVSNDVGVKVSAGPIPQNVLFVDRTSTSGYMRFRGQFSGRESGDVILEVSTEVLTVNEILAIEIIGLRNRTLLGPVFTQAQVQVDFVMNDSSVLRVQNFSAFSGLVTFKISHAEAASVDRVTGVVTLLSDYYDLVTVTVTPLQGLGVTKHVQVYCNTVPPVGGVDIGQEYGPAIPTLTASQRVTLPVRVNPGKSNLLAFDLKILYNDSQVRFVELKRSSAYSHTKGQLYLVDVTNPDNGSPHVADLVFESLVGGVLSIQASVNMLIDERLGFIANFAPTVTSCNVLPLGDTNADCVFDIRDAAFTMAYSLAKERNFVGEFEQTMSKSTTDRMVSILHWLKQR